VIAVYVSAKAESRARQNPEMRGIGVPIPTLDPPWPDGVKIAVVTSRDVPQWRRFAHEVAAAAQPVGHSFPLAEPPSGRYGAEHDRTAFLYRHADRACGYLCLASRLVTGYRSPSDGYRSATHAERIIRPCIMVVWVDVQLRRHGIARQLAIRRCGTLASRHRAWCGPSRSLTAAFSWPRPSPLAACGSLITASKNTAPFVDLPRSVQRLDRGDRHQILHGTGELPVQRDQPVGVELGQCHVLGARRTATSGPITYLAIENQFPGCWAMRAPASEYGTSSPLIGATVCPAQVVRDLLLLG
jgi:hypothetical protein